MSDSPVVRVGVGVFIFREGKFLMGKRKNAHGDGSWSVPGGHMEFGESWEDTARRETREETGLAIKNVRFGALTDDYFAQEGKHYITIWAVSEYESGSAALMEPDKFIEMD